MANSETSDTSVIKDIAEIRTTMTHVKEAVQEMKAKLDSSYVTTDVFEAKFEPVKRITYGIVAILATIVGSFVVWAFSVAFGGK